MVFPSSKPDKVCPFCSRTVKNLGQHVAVQHTAKLEQLERNLTNAPLSEPVTSPPYGTSSSVVTPPPVQYKGVNEMIRDKLDTMLNIKLIQMLESGISPAEINRMMQQQTTPPQNTTLEDIKRYHDLFYREPINSNDASSTDWLELANTAIPLIKEMWPKRTAECDQNVEHRTNEERNSGILEPISEQTSGNTTKPIDLSQKSGNLIRSK